MRKMYYSIREVAERIGVPAHVLRYWESEFPQLRPKKNRAGNRTYRESDIELLKTIHRLVHEEKYTIAGARRQLRQIAGGIVEGGKAEKAEPGQLTLEAGLTPESQAEGGPAEDRSKEEQRQPLSSAERNLLEETRRTLREILDLLQ